MMVPRHFGFLWLLAATVATLPAAPLFVCGSPEIFVVDSSDPTSATATPKKLWRWCAAEAADLPAALRDRFGMTDECKPSADGRLVLVTSPGGGCAAVSYPAGRVLWSARVVNAHSAELLPVDRVIVAGAHGKGQEGCDRLVLFDLTPATSAPLWSTSLDNAHGVVWDARREKLWALGRDELRAYALRAWSSAAPSLTLVATHRLPDTGGHDLQLLPDGDTLVLTTEARVHLFDLVRSTFRPHPTLGDHAHIKGVSTHPRTGRIALVQGTATQAFAHGIELLSPASSLRWPAEKTYKARWLASSLSPSSP